MTSAERPDLSTRTDIHDLVVDFYREVVWDDLLDAVFDGVAEIDWETHIPKLVDYWCRIVLDDPGPKYPIMAAHRALHALEPLGPEHCDRWWTLWSECIDRGWSGPRAEHARSHATSLMAGMARHVFGFEWSPPLAAKGPVGLVVS